MRKLILLTALLLTLLVPVCIRANQLPFDLSGLYLSGNISSNFIVHSKFRGTKAKFQPGILVAPAIGYRFCNGLRVEAEYAYRHTNIKKINFLGTRFHIHGHVETQAGMANLYYDLPINWCLKPYIGGGVGYAASKVKVRHGNFASHRHRSGFAWQLIAGVAYPICNNVDLALEYRFFKHERIHRIQNHNVGASLRYYF